ncbi:hypothetical protein, partial [Staphylococcus aureus]|uniref:hypothetical protein n=1 Tax=Staphylococcus aureus TaxID=1280 RepID=UPI0040369E39
GIIYIDNNETKIIRKPKHRKILNGRMILDMLDKKFLAKETNIKVSNKQQLIERIINTYTPSEIQNIYYTVLKSKTT